ncbi:zinc metalloprotease [Thioclava dalianensis]|uniref:Zinc metalloprotease n=1 Tax=Thioclava dalianensis TaxID=1185766 RepID=A0A074TEF9_9RHOB|nr:RIP metalloprotease RseP [Thioclava dalianensis]KEP70069.1 zinc metalloprotease [Thioclava dalianensis]SFN52081.1 regulator of sigma E protease [Thioclava dalianensis]
MDLLPQFGNLLYTIVAFVVALSIIVAVHEYGHYIVGRWSGIKAEVFSLGFGPKLISRVDKHGTRWQIAAIPLGGYVKFLGDANAASAGADDAEMAQLTPEERRHTMHGAPLWARAATVVAGPVFNFILSIIIITGLSMWTGQATDTPDIDAVVALPQGAGGLQHGDRIIAVNGIKTPDYAALDQAGGDLPAGPDLTYTVERDGQQQQVSGPQLVPARFDGIAPNSAAYDAGLAPGDVITAIDGTPVWRFSALQEAVKTGKGAPIALSIWRPEAGGQGKQFNVTLVPRKTDLPGPAGGFETRFLIGATGSYMFTPVTMPVGPWQALKGGVQSTYGIIAQSISGIKAMIEQQISSCNLSGALRIAETSAAAAKSGPSSFIWFIAVLSTAVGFLNLFPIPVLDGGHLVFHAYEAVRGKPPSDRLMNLFMSVGLALVATLMLFGLWNDLTC